jgi:multiple sugar transport system substrate-binding protein
MRAAISTRPFRIFLVLVLIAGVGCFAFAKGEVTIWVWGDYEIKGTADFSKYFPDIKLNFVQIAYNDYQPKVVTTIASGGDLADIVLLERNPRGKFVNFPVWERLDAPPYNLNRNDIAPYTIPITSNKKGEIVCLQEDLCVGGIAYKRDMAKKYFGTDDPNKLEKIFTTWDDYIKMGKEVAQNSNGKVALFASAQDAFHAIIGWTGFQQQAWVVNGKLNIKSSYLPTYQIIEKMVKNNSIGKYAMWSAAWNTHFASKETIFSPCPTWFFPYVIKPNDKEGAGNWGFMGAPGGGFAWGGTAPAIWNKSKNKAQAWTFLKWLNLSMEGAQSFRDHNGTPTNYKPALETTGFYSAPDPFCGGQDVLAKFVQIASKTKERPVTEYDIVFFENLNPVVMTEMQQGLSAQDAFNMLVREVLKMQPDLKKE